MFINFPQIYTFYYNYSNILLKFAQKISKNKEINTIINKTT